MEELSEFLKEQNEEVKKLANGAAISYWIASISGKKEDYETYEKNAIAMQRYFNNKETFEKVKHFLKTTEDLIEKRQLENLYKEYLSCQGDLNLIERITKKSTQIEQIFNTFRADLDGKELTDNDIKEILKKETDSEKREKVWNSSKKQGEVVEKELIELVELRNELARSLGFKNYFIMSLELSEQKEEEVEKIFLELEKSTEKSFKEAKSEIDESLSKSFGLNKNDLRPWHYHDLFFQETPEIYGTNLNNFYNKDVLEISKKFYTEIGLDVGDILDKSDLYEKPGKNQHAYCINIDREGDVRILENLKNNESWMETTLHELGHAVYDKNCDENLPFLLRENTHIFVTESIALFFGRNSKNIAFMKRYCEISDEESKKISEMLRRQLRLDELVFLKWAQVMFYFERELYKNPRQDLNKIWWDFVKRYQMIDFYRDKPDWASKIHFTIAPIYYHNYLLGKILASQLGHYIIKNILKEDTKNPDYAEKRVGHYLKEKIFMPGKKYRWDKLIENATKEELSPKYFIEEFCN